MLILSRFHKGGEDLVGRLILAIVAAPLIWGVVCIPTNEFVGSFFGDQIATGSYPTAYLAITLLLSIPYSLGAGYGAAWIAGQNELTLSLGAGIAVFAVGFGVQLSAWDKLPLWYHLPFLALLIPMTMLGARIRKPVV